MKIGIFLQRDIETVKDQLEKKTDEVLSLQDANSKLESKVVSQTTR